VKKITSATPPCRIHVVGTTGSGKTTLAQQLAARLGCSHVELDALNWEPEWTMADNAIFRQRTRDALQGECWTVDGNYSRVRDIIWERVEMIVWLDYGLPRIYWQLLKRTLRRTLSREDLWGTNQERFKAQFFSRDSLFLWAWQTYGRRRRDYPILLKEQKEKGVTAVHLTSSHQTKKWLQEFENDQ